MASHVLAEHSGMSANIAVPVHSVAKTVGALPSLVKA